MLTSLISLYASLSIFNSPLTSLNVAGNNIGGQYVKQNEARGDSFKVGNIVEWKGMQGTITQEKDYKGEIFVQFMQGIEAIAEALKVSSPLKQLDISDNKIGKEGAAALAAVLPSR